MTAQRDDDRSFEEIYDDAVALVVACRREDLIAKHRAKNAKDALANALASLQELRGRPGDEAREAAKQLSMLGATLATPDAQRTGDEEWPPQDANFH